MHRDFRKLLKHAVGESEFVLALNIDIRAFSAFSMTVDSSETAMYIKRVYTEIISRFFPKATFFKPTGDGLLIVETYNERTLQAKVETTVRSCLRLVEEFSDLAASDPIVNFEVPTHVGIGAARGAACRLVSGAKTLDYSGRVLNLASRLMGLARPEGLIFDSAFGPELLPDELLQDFASETVYLRGIADDSPVTVFYSKGVDIEETAKHPLGRVEWIAKDQRFKLKDLKGQLPRITFHLTDPPPKDAEQIQVKVITRDPKRPGPMEWDYSRFTRSVDAGVDVISVEHAPVPPLVKKWGIWKNQENITFRVLYPARPTE